MRLYLIRHAQSTWNLQNRIQGSSNPRLSKIGLAQSKKLAGYIKKISIDRCYSSPLMRARQTACAILNGRRNDIIYKEGLKEIDLGAWEGKRPSQIDKDFGNVYKKWLKEPQAIVIPDAETLKNFKNRAVGSILSVINENKQGDTLLVVTHGGVIMAYLSHVLGIDFEKIVFKMKIDNTGITVIDLFGTDAFISAINQTPHL